MPGAARGGTLSQCYGQTSLAQPHSPCGEGQVQSQQVTPPVTQQPEAYQVTLMTQGFWQTPRAQYWQSQTGPGGLHTVSCGPACPIRPAAPPANRAKSPPATPPSQRLRG